jgi:hypothetical protein
MSGRFM